VRTFDEPPAFTALLVPPRAPPPMKDLIISFLHPQTRRPRSRRFCRPKVSHPFSETLQICLFPLNVRFKHVCPSSRAPPFQGTALIC